MFTHFLPWLVAGLATRFTINFLLQRWLSIRLALPSGLALTLFSFALLATWQYELDQPLGLIVGVLLIDLLRGRS